MRLPVLRFVDDYFAAEPEETAKHAKNVFARCAPSSHTHVMYLFTHTCAPRLVRALLGEDAVAEKKLEHGNPLTV